MNESSVSQERVNEYDRESVSKSVQSFFPALPVLGLHVGYGHDDVCRTADGPESP